MERGVVIIRTTSRRSRNKVKLALGRHPQYYFTAVDGGCFVKLDDLAEIEKVLAVKGVSRCREQDEEKYHKCWEVS